MTRTFVPLPRIAALSVAITLFAAPIAAAQSPDAAPPGAAPTNTLLSPAAFARLVQPPPAGATQAPVAKDSPRPSLLRQSREAIARQATAAPAQAPSTPTRSWMARHKWAFIIPAVVAGAILGVFGIAYLVIGEG